MTSPVTEEVTRLLEAVHTWFGDNAAGMPLAGDGPECQLCPVCQLIRLVRTTRPEVVEHLAEASTALLAALRAALDAHEHSWAQGGAQRAVHIDISD